MLGILLAKPKLMGAAAIGVALLGFGIHYKLLTNERDKLRVAEQGYKLAVASFEQREAILAEDALIAKEATRRAIVEREEARAILEEFRAGREDDPESVAWGATPVPIGELVRLCEALPELEGCE